MAQAIPVALGAMQYIDSIGKEKKLAKKSEELARNRPIKRTSQFDNEALRLSESELANGMSAGAEQAYDDSVDRGISSSISALLKSGGSVNNIGDIYDSSEEGRQRLAIMEDQMRIGKIQDVLKQYEKQSSEQEKNWMVNEYGPYKDQLQAVGEQRKTNAQAKVSAINTFASGAMNWIGGDGKLMDDGSKPTTENSSWLSGGRFNQHESPIGVTPQGRAMPSTINPANPFAADANNSDQWTNFWNNYKLNIH